MTCVYGQASRSDSYPPGFIVTWDEIVLEIGSSTHHPVFRIFDTLGNPVTPVLPGAYEEGYVDDCGTRAAGYQHGFAPDVAVAANGEFMLVWSSCSGQDLYPWGAKAWGQTYYADGTPRSGLILLADSWPGDAAYARVAWGNDGNYYAAWADSRTACSTCSWPLNLWVQRVSPAGQKIGPNYIINDVLGGLEEGVSVDIAISRGRACVIWMDYRDYPEEAPDGEMYAQIVSLDLIGHYVHGDVNLDYDFTSADIIYLVNYVFKSGPRPLPGPDYGDVTGDCLTTASDIIYYVNFTFKGGPGFQDSCGS
jgi:hypothetical protein